MNAHAITAATCVLRATNASEGRSRAVAPGLAAVDHLHYGRIILRNQDRQLKFATGDHETGLICLQGRASVRVAEESFELSPYDALYVPRDSQIEVSGIAECDLAELSAPVEHRYPLRFIPFAEVRRDPGLHFKVGSAPNERELNILIGKNVEAGRILAGVTFSAPGNWTSWPPHEHAAMLEEAYVYIAMPPPAWGVQFVYTNPGAPELTTVVHEGDCVVMPKGYHPNVAAPGGCINFLWMMAAHREVADRQFGVVNVQPEYATGTSGLEAGQAAAQR